MPTCLMTSEIEHLTNSRLNGFRKGLYEVLMIPKSGREDLNLRPHGPEPCALAKLSYAPSALIGESNSPEGSVG